MENLITDVVGLAVGNAADIGLISGVTAIIFDEPAVASIAVSGGAPAGRDTQCLEPDAVVPAVDAIVLSGGSGFGLDAASGVQAWLREQGRGFAVGPSRVPIVPMAVVFDLNNGGTPWGRFPPYRDMGYAAAENAVAGAFALGSVGGGTGASTANLKGGLGSASTRTTRGHTVGALVIVNALGSATIGDGPHFWAAAMERQGEFGGRGLPNAFSDGDLALGWKGNTPATTIALVATDAVLNKNQAKRMAVAAQGGLARGLRIAHALMDGDTVFAAATGRAPLADPVGDLIEIGATAADCVTRAIARGVFEATIPGECWCGPPAWRDLFGEQAGGGA